MVLPLATWAADGDEFTITTGDVKLTYRVISEEAKTCMMGKEYGPAYEVPDNWSGSITIPASVTNTETNTTYSVVRISNDALAYLPGLTGVTLPEGLKSIEYNAFGGAGFTSITLPSTLEKIGGGAFRYSNLTSITIPKSVTQIGGDYEYQTAPFARCENLASIILEDGITSKYVLADGGKLLIDTEDKVVVAGLCNASSITIPEGIKIISGEVFAESKASTFTIPESVTEIRNAAFENCVNLTTITLPESLTDLQWGAFNGCTQLSNITLPSPLKSLSGNIFSMTSITEITIPKNVTQFEGAPFWGCGSLSAVTSLIKEPSDVYEDAFYLSDTWDSESNSYVKTYLAKLYVPTGTKSLYEAKTGWNKIASIEEKDLQELIDQPVAGDLLTYTSDEGTIKFTISSVKNKTCKLAKIKKYDVQWNYWTQVSPYEGESETLTIPETVEGYTVTAICEYALQGASSVKSIELPNTITTIENRAFEGIWDLSLVISNNTNPTDVDEEAFAKYTSWDSETQADKTVYYTALSVPVGTKDAYKAKKGWNKFSNFFSGNEGKTLKVQTTEGVEVLYTLLDDEEKTCQVGYIDGQKGKIAIDDSGDETAMTIPATVTYNDVDYKVVAIGNSAFYGCFRILSVNLPEGLTSIGEYAFGYCQQISSLELPSTVTSIGKYAFSYMNKLSFVNSKIETPFDIDEYVFRFSKWNQETQQSEYVYPELLYVPVGTKDAYEAKTGWNKFGAIEELDPNIILFADDNVRQICVNAGWDTDGDNKISKDEAAAVTTISTETGSIFNNFEDGLNYTSFDEFKYFTGVTTIPCNAFKWSLGSITIPKNVTTIESNAFHISNLNTISIDEENAAFVINSGVLTSKDGKLLVRVLKSATEGAFVIPSTIEIIGGGAFYYCDNMTTVSIPSSAVTIEMEAFYGCSGLSEITIPNSVTFIGAYAFAWTKVSSMIIPASVKTIYNGVFSGCYELTDIYLPESDTPITLVIGALSIDDNHIATIHVPLALLDDYALNYASQKNFEAGKVVAKFTPANDYFTFSSGVDVVLPEGVDAYKAQIVSDTQVGITKLTGAELAVDGQNVIKANNGLLLKGTAGTTYDIVAVKGTKVTGNVVVTTDAKSYGDDNQLEPVIESKQFDASDYYVLSNNKFNAIDATSANKVPACKAVLKKPAGVAATRSLSIGDDDTTGIDKVEIATENDTWYNLQGSRIEAPTKKGIYIKNGKKVIIK